MIILIVQLLLFIFNITPTISTSTWKPVTSINKVPGAIQGVYTVSSTSAFLAGGIDGIGNGLFKLEGDNITQVMDIETTSCKICMMTQVKMSSDGTKGLAGGVALLGFPVTYSTSDSGKTWQPSNVVAKGFNGAVSGHDIESLDGGIGNEWGFVSEFNSWANGTICTHGTISTQCSGVLVTKDGGKTYDNIDWHGTDGVDTDAMTGSFPTSKIWYIAGGLVQAESNPGPSFKSTIMKTMDGGETWMTVFNVSAPQNQPGKGVGGMEDVACTTPDICYAISACYDDDCYNYKKQYGSFVHKTIDGGKTWKELGFFYEQAMSKIVTISNDELFIGGGGVGIFDDAVIWKSNDGGETFTNTTLKETGVLLDLSLMKDGKSGFATTVTSVTQSTTVWRFGDDNEVL